jgi:hypothetical protein
MVGQNGLALAGFEPGLRLVDHINAAFATHNAAVTVPVLERAERILDLHGLSPVLWRDPCAFVTGVPAAVTPAGTVNSWWALLGSNQ